jgi:hypothetical protein
VENGNKKKQRVDLIMGVPILISLGGQVSLLENLLWLGRAGRDRVHTCPSRHRHQEERSVLQFFFVAPRAACRSCAQRSHHAQLAGAGRRECGIQMCARGAVCDQAWKTMVRIILVPAGGRLGDWPWKPCICRVRHFAVAES